MEQLAYKLGRYIGNSVNADEEKVAVISYGLIALIQVAVIFTVSLILGIIFDFWAEAMILFFSVGFLRRVIGGAHSARFDSCLVISILVITVLSVLSKYVIVRFTKFIFIIAGIALIYFLASLLIYKLAPVAAPNKPIKSPQKITRLRKTACVTMVSFVIISILLIILSSSAKTQLPETKISDFLLSCCTALALSTLWQTVMLTHLGHTIIYTLDQVFDHIDKILKRRIRL